MKILILADGVAPESLGGAEVVTWNFAQSLATSGEEVHLITTTRKREKEGESEREGVKIHTIYSNYHERWRAYLSLYNPQSVSKVRELIHQIQPDIVHAHNIHYHLSYYCLKLARESGAKVFLTAHDVMLFHYGKMSGGVFGSISAWQQLIKYRLRYNPFRNLVIRFYLRYVHQILAVSEALKRVLEENDINNVEVFYNGIDWLQWLVVGEAMELFRNKYKLQGKKVILFGGRLSRAKGGDQALAALQEVLKTIPEAVLLVLGSSNEYSRLLMKTAEAKGLANSIVFTGWLSGVDLRAAYHVSDVVVMPSICFDTFGMVCLEAMSCYKPVVATCFGGPREIVLDGKTGYIVDPFDTNHLASRVSELLLDKKKAEEFGSSGHARVVDVFGMSRVIGNLLRVYGKWC